MKKGRLLLGTAFSYYDISVLQGPRLSDENRSASKSKAYSTLTNFRPRMDQRVPAAEPSL